MPPPVAPTPPPAALHRHTCLGCTPSSPRPPPRRPA
ncbi:photosystem reaction center subunit H, partial [Burkholderia pseudomallei]